MVTIVLLLWKSQASVKLFRLRDDTHANPFLPDVITKSTEKFTLIIVYLHASIIQLEKFKKKE